MKLISSDQSQQRSYCGTIQRRFVWKMLAMGMKALELDLGAMEEGLPTDKMAPGCTVGQRQTRHSDALGIILLVNLSSRHSCRRQFDTSCV